MNDYLGKIQKWPVDVAHLRKKITLFTIGRGTTKDPLDNYILKPCNPFLMLPK